MPPLGRPAFGRRPPAPLMEGVPLKPP
jgi:hypothetical protein